jgi:hypothetical protein
MTAAQLATLYRRRAVALEREIRKTSRSIGQNAVRTSRHFMEEQIYSVPEDRTAAGKAKWQRTRKLLRGEKYEVLANLAVRVYNEADYAEPRHEAGKPGHRKINPLRVSHWRDEMIEVMRPIALEGWAAAVRDALRTP